MFAESGLVYAMSSLAARGDQVWLRYLVREDRLFCRGQSGGTAFEGGLSRAIVVVPWMDSSEGKGRVRERQK